MTLLNQNNRQRARGFTLTELLVVMVIIISLLAVGTVSLNALVSRSVLREAQAAVVATLRLARQFAISSNAPCIVEIIAIDDHPQRAVAPGTPYRVASDGACDQLRVTPLKALRDPRSGATLYALTPASVKEHTLAEHIVFDDRDERAYPNNFSLPTDFDEDGRADALKAEKIFFQFNADGSCPARTEGEAMRSNVLRLRDANSGETATIVVLPATGYVKAR